MKIGIINYNMGNLASVQNAFDSLGIKTQIQADPSKLSSYDKLILPGVGAFGDAMANLETTGVKEALIEFGKTGKYILGICLGMQLLFEKSQEFGERFGLGFIQGEVVKFQLQDSNLTIPHMGWNQCLLTANGSKHPLLKDIQDNTYLYFVHSYHAICEKSEFLLAECNYGYNFPAIVAKDNILGLQPHPEKSHENGLRILKNFSTL